MLRTRTEDRIPPPVEGVLYKESENVSGTFPNCVRTLVPTTQTTAYNVSYYSKTTQDVVVPDFKKRQAQGVIFNNPFSMETIHASATPRYIDCTWYDIPTTTCSRGYYHVHGNASMELWGVMQNISTYGIAPIIDVTALQNIAVTEAYARINRSEILALVSLAEFEESVSCLYDVLKRAYRILRAVRKLSIGDLKHELKPKELSDMYMQYRYGLRPLVGEAQNAISAFKAITKKGFKPRHSFRARRSGRAETSRLFNWVFNDHVSVDIRSNIHREVIVSAGVLTDIEVASALQILGLDQLSTSAWELIPFSFVADWFFNIGSTIASLTPNFDVRNLASWVTVEDTHTCQLSIDRTITTGLSDFEQCQYSGSMSLIHKTYSRTPDPTRPLLPSFTLNLDGLKLLDLAIMLKNILH